MRSMRIQITIEDTILQGALSDSAAARSFAELLPLTLTLSDFHNTEKIADLPARLSTDGAAAGTAAKAGDLAYYSPWGNLAIFYRDFPYSEGLVALGHIDGSLAPLTDASGDPVITVTRAD
jgi:hypothetical protein